MKTAKRFIVIITLWSIIPLHIQAQLNQVTSGAGLFVRLPYYANLHSSFDQLIDINTKYQSVPSFAIGGNLSVHQNKLRFALGFSFEKKNYSRDFKGEKILNKLTLMNYSVSVFYGSLSQKLIPTIAFVLINGQKYNMADVQNNDKNIENAKVDFNFNYAVRAGLKYQIPVFRKQTFAFMMLYGQYNPKSTEATYGSLNYPCTPWVNGTCKTYGMKPDNGETWEVVSSNFEFGLIIGIEQLFGKNYEIN